MYMADSFCLDLGEDRVKVADIKRSGSLLETLHLGMERIDPVFFRTDSEEVISKTASTVSNLVKKLKIATKSVKIVIPDSFSYNHFIEFPLLNEKELLSAIKYQADQFIPMPLSQVNLDIEIIHEDIEKRRLLTLIASSAKKTIERVQKLAEYSGLIPDSAETETSAIGRFLSNTYSKTNPQEDKNNGLLLINMQYSSTSIYFFDRNLGLMIYSHNFQTGYSLFLKEIQVNLNIEPAKSVELLTNMGVLEGGSYDLQTILTPTIKNFTSNIETAINELTTKSEKKVSKIFLLNEARNFKGLDQLLAKYFAIPAEYINPLPYFVNNNVVNYFKNDLVFFISAFGGALS